MFTFSYRFNFNNDGFVTKEDIRILLSYVPFQDEEESTDKFETHSAHSSRSKNSDGLYKFKGTSFKQRRSDQEELNRFLDSVFDGKTQLNFEQYMQVNQEVSSEMFCSIMRVLHDNLPCTKNYFIQKKRYKNLLKRNSREGSTSPAVRKIASPKFVKGL